jgi:hypothetical protein
VNSAQFVDSLMPCPALQLFENIFSQMECHHLTEGCFLCLLSQVGHASSLNSFWNCTLTL